MVAARVGAKTDYRVQVSGQRGSEGVFEKNRKSRGRAVREKIQKKRKTAAFRGRVLKAAVQPPLLGDFLLWEMKNIFCGARYRGVRFLPAGGFPCRRAAFFAGCQPESVTNPILSTIERACSMKLTYSSPPLLASAASPALPQSEA